MAWYLVLLVLVGVLVVPFLIGGWLARVWRMPDYGWKFRVVLITLVCGVAVVANSASIGWTNIKLGIDLSGGAILIYQIDDSKSEGDIESKELIEAIQLRVDPTGLSDVSVRPYGSKQIEITIPNIDDDELDLIKAKLRQAGVLEFRILANTNSTKPAHTEALDLARAQDDPTIKVITRTETDKDGNKVKVPLARWVPIARETDEDKKGQYKLDPNQLDDALTRPITNAAGEETGYEVLVLIDEYNVTGDYLSVVRSDRDQRSGDLAVAFEMNSRGAPKFGSLTGAHVPEGQVEYGLGIVMDGRLISAPKLKDRISDRGQITGNFSRTEIDALVGVLRSGKLKAVLYPEPISDDKVSSLLGRDTIVKGAWSIGVSLLIVMVFMAFYYRFAGIVAVMALLLNLILILGLMILIKATLTLPGLAGLVLTVGMSVDANVLIFERIREELNRGAALRMAIRNGFGRATTTIVDANLTTLITAIVLYSIGTQAIRGFAVTLILGILMSMYTAIFCSRLVFDVAERRRRLKKLSMAQILGNTAIDFIGKRKIAAVCSVTLIVIGIAAVVARGRDIFDIDFNGGTSVQIVLKEPMPISEIRKRVTAVWDSATVTEVNIEGEQGGKRYKIDTPETIGQEEITQSATDGGKLTKVERVQKQIAEIFTDNGKLLLVAHDMQYDEPAAVKPPTTTPPGGTTPMPGGSTPMPGGSTPMPGGDTPTPGGSTPMPGGDTPMPMPGGATPTDDPRSAPVNPPEPPADMMSRHWPPSTGGPLYFVAAQADDGDPTATPMPGGEGSTASPVNPTGGNTAQPMPTGGNNNAGGDDASATGPVRSVSEISFDDPIRDDPLAAKIKDAAGELKKAGKIELSDADIEGLIVLMRAVIEEPKTGQVTRQESEKAHLRWEVTFAAEPSVVAQVLGKLESNVDGAPVWPSSSLIGGKVAGDTQNTAVAALVTSLLFIIGYIWIRFQKVVFGLAAVVALVHDVLIVLGAIAVSAYVTNFMGWAGIDPFRISLPMVAAFLTIIGYSLNDTIVVFDRIREVRGKSPDLTAEMINTSINQTLRRTLLTSLTTLIVVGILYAFGGHAIHGFAFALLVGVLVGTYSSIFVASPALLWMIKTDQKANRQAAEEAT